jgi:hypothetical protein
VSELSYDKQRQKSRGQKNLVKKPLAVPILVADYGDKKFMVSSISELIDLYVGHATPGNLNNEIDSEDFVKALIAMRYYPRTVEQQNQIDELRAEIQQEESADEKRYRKSRM